MSALIKTGFNFLDLVDLNSKIEKMKDEPWRDATKSLLCKLCDHMTNRKKHARQMQELVLFEVFEYLESLAEEEKREISNYFLDIDNILQVPDIKKIPGKNAVGEDEYDSDEELKKMIEKKTTAMGEVNKAQGEVEGIIKDAGFGKELEEAKDAAKEAVDDAKKSLKDGVKNTIPDPKNVTKGGKKKKIKGGEEGEETKSSNTCDEFVEIVPNFDEDLSDEDKNNIDILIEERTGQLPKNTPEEKLEVLKVKLGIESKGPNPPGKLFYRIPSANNGEEPPTDGEKPPTDGEEPPTDGEKPPVDGEEPSAVSEEPPAVGGKKRKTKKMKGGDDEDAIEDATDNAGDIELDENGEIKTYTEEEKNKICNNDDDVDIPEGEINPSDLIGNGSGDNGPGGGKEMKLRITNPDDFGIGPVPDFGNLGADQDMYVVRHQAQAILDFYTAKIKVMYSDEQVHPEITNLIVAFKKCIKDFIDGHRKENLRFMLQPITQYTSYSHKLLLETVIEDHINNILEMYFTSIKSLNKENESDKKTLVIMSNIFVTKYTSMLEHLIAVVRDPGNYTMKKKIKSIYEKSREKIQCPATFNFEHLIKMPNRNPPYDEEVLERWKEQFEKLEKKGAAKQEINAYNEEKKQDTINIIKQSLESSYKSDVLDNTKIDLDKTEEDDKDKEQVDVKEKESEDKEDEGEENDEEKEDGEEDDEEGENNEEEGENDEEEGENDEEKGENDEEKEEGEKPMSRVDKLNAEAEADDTEESQEQKGGKKYKTSKTYKRKNNKKNKTIKIKCL